MPLDEAPINSPRRALVARTVIHANLDVVPSLRAYRLPELSRFPPRQHLSHVLFPPSCGFRLALPTVISIPLTKMGVSWSSVSECLGDFSDHHSSRYNRVPPSRRVGQSAVSSSRDRAALRQRCVSEEKLTISAASQGAAIAPPPPPLVPDSNAVYNLLEDEDEDVCPTCLETYASDNPKITSTCGHSFHLQCIVAWETRSGSRFCPICAKLMEYVEADQPSAISVA